MAAIGSSANNFSISLEMVQRTIHCKYCNLCSTESCHASYDDSCIDVCSLCQEVAWKESWKKTIAKLEEEDRIVRIACPEVGDHDDLSRLEVYGRPPYNSSIGSLLRFLFKTWWRNIKRRLV